MTGAPVSKAPSWADTPVVRRHAERLDRCQTPGLVKTARVEQLCQSFHRDGAAG